MNQYVNPIGLARIAWKFYFVYIVILVFECLTIWFFFVETKGFTLEEVGVLLDGKTIPMGDDRKLEEEDKRGIQVEHMEVLHAE